MDEAMSAEVMPKPQSRPGVALALLPWVLLVLFVLVDLAGTFFWLANLQGAGRESDASLTADLFDRLTVIVLAGVGVIIAARRPNNPIGWLLLLIALAQCLTEATTAYAIYGLVTQPGAVPAGLWALWASQWTQWVPIYGFILLLLVFPTGHLLSRRWRLVAWAGVVPAGLLALGSSLATPLHLLNAPSGLAFPNPTGGIDESSIPLIFFLGSFVLLVGVFLAALSSLVIRFRRAKGDERLQLKWFTYAAAVAVLAFPLNLIGEWGQAVSNIAFLFVPIAIGIAVLKYRLYEIDLLINRTLVYVPLTAILAGLFAATITLTQKLFVAVTGQSSDAAAVLTTLVVVAAFEPLKKWLQERVDRRFKDVGDPTKRLKAFGDKVQSDYGAISQRRMARRLLNEVAVAYDVTGGAVYLRTNSQEQLVCSRGRQNGKPDLSLPIESDGLRFGHLDLGPRESGANYSAADRAALEHLLTVVAAAMEEDAR